MLTDGDKFALQMRIWTGGCVDGRKLVGQQSWSGLDTGGLERSDGD